MDLIVIYGENTSAPPGYTKIDVNLNKANLSHEVVYLCYKKSASELPITGINVFGAFREDFPIQSGYTKVQGDLNKGASGEYIYVCYTKDERSPPVSDVIVIHGGASTTYPDVQYVRIDHDCNRASGGDYIYICYHQPR